jgi:RNA polymerase sigma factor FliA
MEPAGRAQGTTTQPPNRLSLEEQQDLVLQYTPLVKHIARSLPLEIPGVLEFEDAVGYGMCGLVEAVRRFDPSRGTNFHAYAVRRVRGSMIDAFRRMDRLSRTMRQKARDVQRAQGELQMSLGRMPSDSEAADHLGLSLDDYRSAAANGRWITVSLDRLLGGSADGEGNPSAEMPTADEDIDFTRAFEEQEMLAVLARAVSTLPARERTVVSLYYVDQLTMKEIATILNVSETRISQLHGQAVRRLRSALISAEAA